MDENYSASSGVVLLAFCVSMTPTTTGGQRESRDPTSSGSSSSAGHLSISRPNPVRSSPTSSATSPPPSSASVSTYYASDPNPGPFHDVFQNMQGGGPDYDEKGKGLLVLVQAILYVRQG